MADKRMILQDKYGNALDVPVREAHPVTADRVRYPGFKQETLLLKKGSIRSKGYMPLPCDIIMERDVEIILRDGTKIYTDVFRPADDDRHPALLAVSPYGKEIGGQWLDDIPGRSGVPKAATSGLHKFEAPDPAYWCQHGYAVVNPDLRGANHSEGVILYFGHQYALDGCDIIDWIAKQSWSNENVGMSGNSWLAISQWFIAAERPKHLKAIAPWEGLNDAYREVGTRGGVPKTEFVNLLSNTYASTADGGIEDCIQAMEEHPVMDAYWQDKIADLEQIDIPAYIVASYTNTIHTFGTFEGYRRISSKEKWLRVHDNNEWKDYYTPENMDDLRRFFDHYLKGEQNGWENTPRVRYAMLNPGRKNDLNRVAEDWPLPDVEYKKLYLNGENHTMQWSPVQTESTCVYDSDSKKHKIVYKLKVQEKFEFCGYIKLRLWVSPLDYDDMDLEVCLEKLTPLGTSFLDMPTSARRAVGDLRLSLRELDEKRSTEQRPYQTFAHIQKVKPGEIVPVDICIWPMGMVFEKGDVMRLTISAYKTPPVDGPMSNVFGSARITVPKEGYTYMPKSKVEMVTLGGNSKEIPAGAVRRTLPGDVNKGRHAIYSGGQYESYLYLPCLPLKEDSRKEKSSENHSRLKMISALMVFIASIFVNAYFQVTSFLALVQWFLKTSKVTDIGEQVNQILSKSDHTIGVRIAFGLLMTIFVMVFLLLAAYWEEKEKKHKHLFERACSTMRVPLLLMLAAALLMKVSFAAGIVFSIGAAINCVSVMISSGKKANVNGHLLVLASTAFFLVTVVLLTRNHFATLLTAL